MILPGIIGFIAGIIVGALLGRMSVLWFPNTQINDRHFVMVSVTFIFVGSVVISWINPVYQVSPFIYTLMGSIVGVLFVKPKDNE